MLVSPHRTQRPWQGRREPEAAISGRRTIRSVTSAREMCARMASAIPTTTATFVFTNDFAALLLGRRRRRARGVTRSSRAQAVRGTCRVICFSPRHDLTLARMTVPDIRRVIDTWAEQTAELGREWRWVQVFENKGDDHGLLESASARAGLGERRAAERDREGGSRAASLLRGERRAVARRLRAARAGERRARGGGKRALARGRAVLGGVAV